jgi:hypothetical protein
METAAFCAGLMLYLILTGVHPYPAATIYQDMREGIFLPPHLAAAGLDKKMSELILAALLLPVEKKRTSKSGSDILAGFLEILMDRENRTTDLSSFFNTLTTEENARFEKERKQYFFRQNTVVKIRRFAVQNKYAILGIAVGLLFVLFIFFSTTKSFSQRPTTAGMASDTVIMAYYDAFSSLNHLFMEACVMGADKTDINAAAGLYAITKTREAYEPTNTPLLIPARIWKENGGELPAPNVFGVTDLKITYLAGSEEDSMILYRTEYSLWSPSDDYAIKRSDVITLTRDRRKKLAHYGNTANRILMFQFSYKLPESQLLIKERDSEPSAGSSGKLSRLNHAASSISIPSGFTVPDKYRALKPIISELGKGQGWDLT